MASQKLSIFDWRLMYTLYDAWLLNKDVEMKYLEPNTLRFYGLWALASIQGFEMSDKAVRVNLISFSAHYRSDSRKKIQGRETRLQRPCHILWRRKSTSCSAYMFQFIWLHSKDTWTKNDPKGLYYEGVWFSHQTVGVRIAQGKTLLQIQSLKFKISQGSKVSKCPTHTYTL